MTAAGACALGVCAVDTEDCAESCEDGSLCVAGSCEPLLPDPYIEDLTKATGLHNAMAVSPSGDIAYVFYDRSSGNLYGSLREEGSFTAPRLIDGLARQDPFVGDSGIGASIAADASGTWHLSWVDGGEEALRYTTMSPSGQVATPETVDDGSTDGTNRYFDGRHIVGDDSSIAVAESGEVRVVYQDTTDGTAMLATKRPGQSWTLEVIERFGHTGYWLDQVVIRNRSFVTTWWRGLAPDLNDSGLTVLTLD